MVDDEVRVLDALRRNLHGRWDIDTATSGPEALAAIAAAENPYAVVVSDMMMPGMNGAEFLSRAREASPDSVQLILSGQAELSSTIAAVNNGNLFRFLTKPCEAAELARAVDAALAQYRLIHSERELLERTLDGAVEVLTELMSAANPLAFRRTEAVKALTEAVATAAGLTATWELRIAAMIGQVGLMAVPVEVLTEIREGAEISAEAREIFGGHPRLSYDLIRRIPRLERVAEWVAAQPVTFEDATNPAPPPTVAATVDVEAAAGDGDAASARDVYAVVMAFVVGVDAGIAAGIVVNRLAKSRRYPQALLDTVLQAHLHTAIRQPRQVEGRQLMVGMLVNQDVVTTTGLTLVRGGEVLTESMAIRLRHFAAGVGILEPINVLV
jgi:CheY-like chemotaxis protein